MTLNPLIEDDGIKLEALYAFEREQRRLDENLREYDYFFKGTFKFGGAFEIVNNRKFDDADGSATSLTTDDRAKIRGSGWIERDVAGDTCRIYYGVKSLGNIEALSQPYSQLADGGAPTDFAKDGPINEAIQVYEVTSPYKITIRVETSGGMITPGQPSMVILISRTHGIVQEENRVLQAHLNSRVLYISRLQL